MTHAEEIMQAVAVLVKREGRDSFTRQDIRDTLRFDPKTWLNGYTTIFQSMRVDHGGKASVAGKRFQKVFQYADREAHTHTLTEYGWQLLKEFEPT